MSDEITFDEPERAIVPLEQIVEPAPGYGEDTGSGSGQKNKGGRPLLLTPKLQKAICDILSSGNSIQAACDWVGINVATYHDWVERGEGKHRSRPQNKVFVEFVDAIKKARSTAEITSVARIRKAARGGDIVSVTEVIRPDGAVERTTKYSTGAWQADAWFLERSRPRTWGRIQHDVTLTIRPEKPLERMTDEELDRYIEEAEKARMLPGN
jgi:hypothetical protein